MANLEQRALKCDSGKSALCPILKGCIQAVEERALTLRVKGEAQASENPGEGAVQPGSQRRPLSEMLRMLRAKLRG